jgi:5S rRNA maturation endonuclease (ribonuclease M5)
MLGLEMSDLFPPKCNGNRPERKIVATYPYTDENGRLLFEVVRFDPKDFAQRRPDGKGGWVWNLEGVRRVLYRLPDVLKAVQAGGMVFIVEGEKDADALCGLGLMATTNPHGAGKWREDYSETLKGAHVVILPDKDDAGRKHAESVAKSLWGKARTIKVVELSGDSVKDVSDWLRAGGTKEELLKLVAHAPEWRPAPAMAYEKLRETFGKWLYLPDDTPLRFILCAVIANKLPGDPLWAFVVAPSGSSKTELLNALMGLDFVKPLDTLTTSTFLSGKQKKDPNASLLLRVPYGTIFVMRDFTSILEMHTEKRAEIFGQLRKIYDGHLTKATGEGGESAELHWEGKVALVAGVTPAIEGYRAFATTLGERFLYFYLPIADRVTVAKAARRNRASLNQMREELKQAVKDFFAGLSIPSSVEAPDEIGDWIVAVADFVSIARSSVERDWYSAAKEITELPDPEVPTRLAQQLDVLTCAHAVLMGRACVEPQDLELTRQVCLACIPSHRRKLLAILYQSAREMTTTEIANAIDLPTNTVRRYLEDLAALRLVHRREGDTNAFLWQITEFAQQGWRTLAQPVTCGVTENASPVPQKDLALQKPPTTHTDTLQEEGVCGCVVAGFCSATPKEPLGSENPVAPQMPEPPPDDDDVPF